MKWFGKSARSGEAVQKTSPEAERELERQVLQYAEGLELPVPEEAIEVKLHAPRYLLVYAKERESAYLNAGYVLGQAAMLLRFRGVDAEILRQVPDSVKRLPDGRTCLAALAFGGTLSRRCIAGKREQAQPELPFIYRETDEHWTEHVLEQAAGFPDVQFRTGVQIVRRRNVIHFMAVRRFGISAEEIRFHAGLMLAAVMTAGEEQWMELSVLPIQTVRRTEGADYLISVCRKRDRAAWEAGELEDMEETPAKCRTLPEKKRRGKRSGMFRQGHRWNYA